jgi:hypothetical protein
MNGDWQTWSAAGVVIMTAIVFVIRAMKRKKRSSGCGTCGGGSKTPTKM